MIQHQTKTRTLGDHAFTVLIIHAAAAGYPAGKIINLAQVFL